MDSSASQLVSSNWLDPKIVVPLICVVLASVIVPILLHYLKGRRERANSIIELRTKAYMEYFKKFEDISKNVGHDYETFTKVTLVEEFRKLIENEASNESLVEFKNKVGSFPNDIQEAYRKATNEITIASLLGTPDLFQLIAEFESLLEEMLTMSANWLEESNSYLTNQKSPVPFSEEMTEKGKKVKELKNKIILQMRREINLAK